MTGGNRPAPPPSQRFFFLGVEDLFLTYPPNPKVDRSGKIFLVASFPFDFLCEIRRDDSRAQFDEPTNEKARCGGAVPAEAGGAPLAYPPNPEVDQSGKSCFVASFPFDFLCEIRRDDSRARSAEPPDEQRRWSSGGVRTQTPSSYTHRTRRSADLANFCSSRVFHSIFSAKSEGATHEHNFASRPLKKSTGHPPPGQARTHRPSSSRAGKTMQKQTPPAGRPNQ